jgi:dCMP deaminase
VAIKARRLIRPDWSTWALGIAEASAARSEDPYVQVGAVALRYDWSIIGCGYNGLPAGVEVPPDFWDDRDGRRPFMIHAEVNALRYARAGEVGRVVTTHIPCANCVSVLGSYHIGIVEWHHELGDAHDMSLIEKIAEMNGIRLKRIGVRNEGTQMGIEARGIHDDRGDGYGEVTNG